MIHWILWRLRRGSRRPKTARHGTRNWRLRRAFRWLAASIILGLTAWNAYDAGHKQGWRRGYDAASVAEAVAWRAVPKACPPCPTVTPFDLAFDCERWWFEHNPVINPTFKVDPRGAR